MSFPGVVRNPVYLQVGDQLRDAIFDGRLRPGEPLPAERELAEQFGVSRQTVREALRALEAQGLVSGGAKTPMRMTVANGHLSGPLRDALGNLIRLQRISLDDLLELRFAIEGTALKSAAAGPVEEAITDARAALTEMLRPDISLEEFDEADVRFHIAMVAASGNEAMHLIMRAVSNTVSHYLLDSLRNVKRSRRALAKLASEHAQILEAVEAGEGDRASWLVQAHLAAFYRNQNPTREAKIHDPSGIGIEESP